MRVNRGFRLVAAGRCHCGSAVLTVFVKTPTDADRLTKNPLGVSVGALNWSKDLG